MSPRRLSWRRRRDTSTSSQSSAPDAYQPDPQLEPLHRSMSDLSPISPMSDRDTFVDEHGRRFTRTGITRRQQSEDSALLSPRHEYAPYHPQYYRPDTAPRAGPSVITSFTHDASAPVAPHLQSTASWPARVDSMAQSYGFQPSYMGFNPVANNNPYEQWAYNSNSPSQASTQTSFMTSPTTYSGSSSAQYEGRTQNWSRVSRPPGTMHSTYPPITTPTVRRESEPVDEFTSPTEFALFAAATSSLDISPAPSPNPITSSWSHVPVQQPSARYVPAAPAAPYIQPQPQPQPGLSAARLAAPLPPVPQQPRSRSSPASMVVRRQASRQEMIAEALAGLDLDDRVDSDDDELPNYEQSQAEVAAAKRREAAARARELNDAWTRARRRGA